MRFLKDFLPNLLISMLLGMAVIVIMDEFNPIMKFLTSKATKTYIIVMCVVGIITAAMYIAERRKNS